MTLLGAMTVDGIVACMQVDEATTAEIFEAFVREVLVPVLRPGRVVLMDNLSAHKRLVVRQLIEWAAARLCFLPRSSPEFNPIELAWAKVKRLLRGWKARTEAALDGAISQAFEAIKAKDARGWFANAGYTLSAD